MDATPSTNLQPALPALAAHDRVCGNCGHCGRSNQIRECRRHPPQLMYLPAPMATISGAPPRISWITNAAYPPVGDKTPACGDFEAKVELVN